MVETASPSRWGCCRGSGRRQRSEAGARIPRVGGRCRNVARAITTHRFGLTGHSERTAIDWRGIQSFVRVADHPDTIRPRNLSFADRLRAEWNGNRSFRGVSENLARILEN